ncbi:MAG: hypothetical protein QGI75_06485, partial [Phycisphaerales bacterium]|nr:hypothetical protein [Phycisphaerales bacterium]
MQHTDTDDAHEGPFWLGRLRGDILPVMSMHMMSLVMMLAPSDPTGSGDVAKDVVESELVTLLTM